MNKIISPPPHSVKDYTDFTHIDMSPEERKKLDVGDIYMNVATCNDCGWVIRSRNRHHLDTCKCGNSFIDGGSWYTRVGGNVLTHTVLYTNLHKNG